MKNNILVFDSNILYVNYDKGGNFNSFYFNSTFQNVIDYIQQKDIFENIIIYIPEVVWKEMKKQKIDSYEKKKEELFSKLNKIKIPDIVLIKQQDIDYETYISEQIENYKKDLENKLVTIKELDLPSKERFQNIVKRAFEKRPPFGGKENNSDKGFKDVLIWESILELKTNNKSYEIVFYCNDNVFNELLIKEYREMFDSDICICKNEMELFAYLDKLSSRLNGVNYNNSFNIKETNFIKETILDKPFRIRLLNLFNENNMFNDFYVVEDINNLEIKNIVYNGELDYWDVNINVNLLLNIPDGNVETIIEKEKSLELTFSIRDGDIGRITVDYNNHYFEEE